MPAESRKNAAEFQKKRAERRPNASEHYASGSHEKAAHRAGHKEQDNAHSKEPNKNNASIHGAK